MRKNRLLLIAIGLFFLQILFYYSLRYFPATVESLYSTGIYPYIAKAMRFGLGWIPFSFGDIVYSVSIIMIIRWLWLSNRDLISLSRKRYTQLFLSLNIIIALFHCMWGFNYYREPLHEVLDLDNEYTTEELETVVRQLIYTSNKLHDQLQPVDSLPVVFERSQSELFELAPQGFENIDHIYPALSYGNASIKKSLLTIPLSYMGYSGYLNPLTGEAHTNAWINNYKTPVLTLHEMSHQLGFAKENEANFIAIIAGMNHDDLYFQYSASIFALRYCINDLYRRDLEKYENIRPLIKDGIFKNYKELRDFWKQYEGVIEDVSQVTYNAYLKANNQPGGMETYSYVVALLVNYYK
ncbi:uncharacterized protein DUF3810 [Nonlabens dokdonensis]|uniref:3-deoxy-manno-octulosonate cytidylyltransferase n=2 Tax=Nonlabens dokdonensis TaxID=328515 RepID=L7WD99_NONDD|nr:DUF3810 domain-containing protein [Nonlabens dokdonensis]AGC78227.1 3-deoxy-manno-octulosonate cytidylyltransferase [Nonlabens dokdonensis DSW-6]PZX37882.1 uncharacterized protein DUF3810 [Nonlabens dokdonensis]